MAKHQITNTVDYRTPDLVIKTLLITGGTEANLGPIIDGFVLTATSDPEQCNATVA